MVKKTAVLAGVLVALYLSAHIYFLYTGRMALDKEPPGYTPQSAAYTLTVVEFLDYSCPYCQAVHPTITEAVRQDGRVRYIPRPLPSGNENANFAASLVYAAGLQGKYMDMHTLMMEEFETFDEPIDSDIVIYTLASKLGLDESILHDSASSAATKAMVFEGYELFDKMGGSATPTFIIGRDTLYVPEGRMPTVQDFLSMFDEARGLK